MTIRKTVIQSLERLKTDYLDAVFLHDVEFVCTQVAPRAIGNHVSSLKEDAAAYGLANGDETCIRGEGDQKILDAYHELQALQREGLVRNIGITGMFYLVCLEFALTLFRLPIAYALAFGDFDTTHPTLQTCGHPLILFPSLFAKLHFSGVHSTFLRTRQSWSTSCRIPSQHGTSHAKATILASCPSRVTKGCS